MKKFWGRTWLAALCSVALLLGGGYFTSCGDDGDDDNNTTVSVTGVSLDKNTASIALDAADKTLTLKETVLPENASNKNVTWISSKLSVATVENGVVKGVGEGTTVITVTTQDGNHTAKCKITVVKEAKPATAETITGTYTIGGETYTISADGKVTNAAGEEVGTAKVSNGSVTITDSEDNLLYTAETDASGAIDTSSVKDGSGAEVEVKEEASTKTVAGTYTFDDAPVTINPDGTITDENGDVIGSATVEKDENGNSVVTVTIGTGDDAETYTAKTDENGFIDTSTVVDDAGKPVDVKDEDDVDSGDKEPVTPVSPVETSENTDVALYTLNTADKVLVDGTATNFSEVPALTSETVLKNWGDGGSVANGGYLLFREQVTSENSLGIQCLLQYDSSQIAGLGVLETDGTSLTGYAISTANGSRGVRYANTGASENGAGYSFSNGKSKTDWPADGTWLLVKFASIKGKWYTEIYDETGTTLYAYKNNTPAFTAGTAVFLGIGGIYTSQLSVKDIKVSKNASVSSNVITLGDAESVTKILYNQLPALSVTPSGDTDSLAPSIPTDGTAIYTVTATNAGQAVSFTAVSADKSIAQVSVNGTALTITGGTPGDTTVTVTNKADPTLVLTTVIKVNVANYPATNADYALATKAYPATGASSAYTDGYLKLAFDSAPTLASTGFVSIFNEDGAIVDTIHMSDETQSPNSGNKIKVQTQLVRVVGNNVYITPHFGALQNGTKYIVGIPSGAITGTINNVSFTGLNPKASANLWSFTTRAAKSASATMKVSTAEVESNAAGAPDFRTVYGALAAIGKSSSDSYTINLAAGEYYELVNASLNATVKIVGPSTATPGFETGTDTSKNAVIKYINHNAWNAGTDIRPSFFVKGTGSLILENVTIWNAARRGTAAQVAQDPVQYSASGELQAEALYFKSTGTVAAYKSTFKSYQDTVQLGNKGGKGWFYKCYIEGDVDFLWGTADVALFEECTLKALNDPARSTKSEDLLVARTYISSGNTVAKGFVVFNSEIQVEDDITLSFGRCAGSGDGFYDQCAIVDTKVTGTLSEAWWSADKYTPYPEHEAHVGWKDYNVTDGTNTLSPAAGKRCAKTSAIANDVYAKEYNGRRTILNRVYSVAASKYADGSAWKESDLAALETEFNAATDASKDNVYEEVWLAKTWEFTDSTPVRTQNGTTWIKTDGTKSASAPTSASDAAIWIYGDATKETGNSYIDPKGTLYGSAILYVPVASGCKVTVTYFVNASCYLTIGGTQYTATSSTSVDIDCDSATLKTSSDVSALVSGVSYLPIELGSDTLTGTSMKGYVPKIVVDKKD